MQSDAFAQTSRQLPSPAQIDRAIKICTLQDFSKIEGQAKASANLWEFFKGILDASVAIDASAKSGADITLTKDNLDVLIYGSSCVRSILFGDDLDDISIADAFRPGDAIIRNERGNFCDDEDQRCFLFIRSHEIRAASFDRKVKFVGESRMLTTGNGSHSTNQLELLQDNKPCGKRLDEDRSGVANVSQLEVKEACELVLKKDVVSILTVKVQSKNVNHLLAVIRARATLAASE
jgi:hypothetical protein